MDANKQTIFTNLEFSKRKAELKSICEKWSIQHMYAFGSVLRADFQPHSDIDLLLEFEIKQEPSYFKLVLLKDRLESLFHRKVDLVTRKGLLNSRNQQRAQAILSSCQILPL